MAQQTIEPTMVAGFNQLFDDLNGTKADQAGAGLDFRLTSDVAVGVEGIYRRLSPLREDNEIDDTDILVRDANETLGKPTCIGRPPTVSRCHSSCAAAISASMRINPTSIPNR